MRPHNVGIIDRVIEELSALGDTPIEIGERLGCSTKLVRYWLDDINTPSAVYFQRFHEAGCDVLYMLTGKRYTIAGGDIDV